MAKKSDNSIKESFSIFQGTYKGHALSGSYDINLYKLGDNKKYPHMVGVSIQGFNVSPNGLPEASEFPALNESEDWFISAMKNGGRGVYVGHSYWNNSLELVFYVADAETTKRLLDKLLLSEEKPLFPWAYKIESDPQWKIFEDLLKPLIEKGEVKSKIVEKIKDKTNLDTGWNDMLGLIFSAKAPKSLNTEQLTLYYALTYDSEVQNGGHFQYFENKKGKGLTDTLKALRVLGANEQISILDAAKKIFLDETRPPAKTKEEFVARANEGKYTKLDNDYYKANPSVTGLANEYLLENKHKILTKKKVTTAQPKGKVLPLLVRKPNWKKFLFVNLAAIMLAVSVFFLPSANYKDGSINLLINLVGFAGLFSMLYIVVELIIIPIFLYRFSSLVGGGFAGLLYRMSEGHIDINDPYTIVMKKWFSKYSGFSRDSDSKVKTDKKTLHVLSEALVKEFPSLKLDYSPESLRLIDEIILSRNVAFLAAKTKSTDFPNRFIGVMTEICAYTLETVAKDLGEEVTIEFPIWESSIIYDSKKKAIANVGIWPIKCYSYGISDSVYSKYQAIEQLSFKKS